MIEKPTVGFIGTGVMGRSMSGHILRAGYPLAVFNRSQEKAQPLVHAGAQWCESPRELAARSDVVITMLGYPTDVEEVYLGEGALVAAAKAGAVLIDTTTSSPALARTIAAAAMARGVAALDAPVSGGDIGARDARLVFMVGGEEATFQRTKPLLRLMGSNIVRHGEAGAGQHCKMANQIAVAAGMVGWVEALAYAWEAGLDPARVLESISDGAAGSWAMTNLAPRALADNYAPGFYVRHMLKDLRIALESASEMRLDLPGLACAKKLYDAVAARGWAENGTQVLYKHYTERSPAAARNDSA